jgi:hypothetical protein
VLLVRERRGLDVADGLVEVADDARGELAADRKRPSPLRIPGPR